MSLKLSSPATRLLNLAAKGIGLSAGVGFLFSGSGVLAQADIVIDAQGSPSGGITSTGTVTSNSDTRFTCQINNGEYTVMYHPEAGGGQPYAWATPKALGGGWTAQKRCTSISQRLESYRPDGLVDLRTSVQNGYNTICALTERNSACRIVFTVPPRQDPETTLASVFQNLTLADSGQSTYGVNTFTNRSNGLDLLNGLLGRGTSGQVRSTAKTRVSNIYLKPFLSVKDGGTARYLRNTTNTPANTQTRPQLFRRR
ncbi:MAG TPA: COP23 domain-containing protein [Candidatus Sericytochromatia bacterium]